MKESVFPQTFKKLKAILQAYQKHLTVTVDKKDRYNLNAGYSEKHRRDIYFGGVEIKKNYVSFHLVPVYVNPDLLKGISPELKKRMQGKSCFNFKVIDQSQIDELAHLTKMGFEFFKKEGML